MVIVLDFHLAFVAHTLKMLSHYHMLLSVMAFKRNCNCIARQRNNNKKYVMQSPLTDDTNYMYMLRDNVTRDAFALDLELSIHKQSGNQLEIGLCGILDASYHRWLCSITNALHCTLDYIKLHFDWNCVTFAHFSD